MIFFNDVIVREEKKMDLDKHIGMLEEKLEALLKLREERDELRVKLVESGMSVDAIEAALKAQFGGVNKKRKGVSLPERLTDVADDVVVFVSTNGPVSISKIVEGLPHPEADLRECVSFLVDGGRLERIGKKKGSKYVTTPSTEVV